MSPRTTRTLPHRLSRSSRIGLTPSERPPMALRAQVRWLAGNTLPQRSGVLYPLQAGASATSVRGARRAGQIRDVGAVMPSWTARSWRSMTYGRTHLLVFQHGRGWLHYAAFRMCLGSTGKDLRAQPLTRRKRRPGGPRFRGPLQRSLGCSLWRSTGGSCSRQPRGLTWRASWRSESATPIRGRLPGTR